MKKYILLSTIAISLILSCKPTSERLVGNWTVSDCSITNLEDIRKKQLEGTPDSLIEQAKSMLNDEIAKFIETSKKETFDFGKDSFNVFHRGRKYSGIWKISSDKKMIFLVPNDNAPTDAFELQGIESKELKISKPITPESSAVYTLKKQ